VEEFCESLTEGLHSDHILLEYWSLVIGMSQQFLQENGVIGNVFT